MFLRRLIKGHLIPSPINRSVISSIDSSIDSLKPYSMSLRREGRGSLTSSLRLTELFQQKDWFYIHQGKRLAEILCDLERHLRLQRSGIATVPESVTTLTDDITTITNSLVDPTLAKIINALEEKELWPIQVHWADCATYVMDAPKADLPSEKYRRIVAPPHFTWTCSVCAIDLEKEFSLLWHTAYE
ncbi:hypothetical protein M501DRAFT_1058801 [Patellaria atrata CBS 101060]|uniref:Uncharacterized protein n=1 Tax=Patellaria atrata CBS 101060 TaxID=1346257 RepID=A0A9P4VRV7_9PEZI|nr:hypothetical protein M501DRAFT_1058801 [Patellaria atrata CBS 101060]